MARTRKLDLVGLAEAAALVGISPNGLSARRGRPEGDILDRRYLPALPDPVAELRCGPIWTRGQIEDYTAEITRFRKMSFTERLDEFEERPKRRKSR